MQYELFFTAIAQIIPVLLLAIAIEIRAQVKEEWQHPELRDALYSAGTYWPTVASLVPAELLALLVIIRSDAAWLDAALVGIPTGLGLIAVFLAISASLDSSPTGGRTTPEQIERTERVVANAMAYLSVMVVWFSLGYLPFRLFLDPQYAAIPGGLVVISYAIQRRRDRPPDGGSESTGTAGK